MTDAARERRLRELFDRALELPPPQREQVIAQAGDELLAERLRALLAQDALGTATPLQRSPAAGLQQLRRVGRYELLRELGSGGMGTVVLACQLEPVERLVAMKLLRPGEDAQELARRFATERQVLAVMNHPGIARIFDGGTADDGTPYFVMEYVRGERITDYCDRRQLDCGARLALFVKVCEAVQYAHQKAVLHRDLKPGNVLVTEEGGSPQPKVIDFGVARLLTGMPGPAQVTVAGSLVGTFVYMSPEQADPGGQDVDTRADIYSLGVVLYELLTGRLPLAYDPQQQGPLGFQRALLETPPPRASACVLALPPAQRQDGARRRGTTAAAWPGLLQGDLDWILARALEKDRNRRYASAAELALDLQRHQRSEPVDAGPPTARYRCARFVRRHRLAVAAAALVVLGLLAGILTATAGMFAARAARDQEAAARTQQARQLRRQRAVSDYLELVLFHGDPGTGSAPAPLRSVLDALTPKIGARLAGRPIEESAVRAAVGRIYLACGEPAKAEPQMRAAWQLVAADPQEDPAVACQLLCNLDQARRLAGGQGAGPDELARMLALGQRATAGTRPEVAQRLGQLSDLVGRAAPPWSEIQARGEELLDLIAPMPWDAEPTRIAGRLLSAVGMRLEDQQVPDVHRFADRIEVLARRNLGDDVDFLQVLGRFAEDQLRSGDFARSRRVSTEVLEALARLGLGDHWLQLRAERIRGLALVLDGESAAGETALLALQRRLWPLSPAANEQARAAANVLAELCVRLADAGRLQPFLAASLQRWQQVATAEPACAPWWPADAEGLPGAATAAARAAVEQAIAAGTSPRLQALLGGLLLREDRGEAAAAALESALAALPEPGPELLADAAIARARIGQAAGAAALVARLRAGSEVAGSPERRLERARHRVAAAGLR